MPITKQEAVTVRPGQLLYHAREKNADSTATRVRVNGRCQTWKTRPDDFKLPVKYGLKTCFYITPSNAAEWSTVPPGQMPTEEPILYKGIHDYLPGDKA